MGYFEDDILNMFETIPRESKKKDTEKTANKETLNNPLNLSFSDELLKSFELQYKHSRANLIGAIKRANINGWKEIK